MRIRSLQVMMCFVLIPTICNAAPQKSNPPLNPLIKQDRPSYLDNEARHVCADPRDAVVGVEVTNYLEDEKTLVRRSNGALIRCDGYVLAPVEVVDRTYPHNGKTHIHNKQRLVVIIHPGSDHEIRVPAFEPYMRADKQRVVVLYAPGIHEPALRTLLPDSLKPDDDLRVYYAPWDDTHQRYKPVESCKNKMGAPLKPDKPEHFGEALFDEWVIDAPDGAVVIGPEGFDVGLLPTHTQGAQCPRFLTMSLLASVTDCVGAEPITDTDYARLGKSTAAFNDDPDAHVDLNKQNEDPHVGVVVQEAVVPNTTLTYGASSMVSIPGGPVRLPESIVADHPELNGVCFACVAPFKMDKYQVTNAQYLGFWRALPVDIRGDPKRSVAYWPTGWNTEEAPFPMEIATLPVLGVPFEGSAAYAKSLGLRLPTIYEWCLAALGPDGERTNPQWVTEYIKDRWTAYNRVLKGWSEEILQDPTVREYHLTSFNGLVYVSYCCNSKSSTTGENNNKVTTVRFKMSLPESYQRVYKEPLVYYLQGDDKRVTDQLVDRVTHQFFTLLKDLIDFIDGGARDVVLPITDELFAKYCNPGHIVSVGYRKYDISPYGVRDMLMNGVETVQPTPGYDYNGIRNYVYIDWKFDDKAEQHLYCHDPIVEPSIGFPYAWLPLTKGIHYGFLDSFQKLQIEKEANASNNTDEQHMALNPVRRFVTRYWKILPEYVGPWLINDRLNFDQFHTDYLEAVVTAWQFEPRRNERSIGAPLRIFPNPVGDLKHKFYKAYVVQPIGFRCVR